MPSQQLASPAPAHCAPSGLQVELDPPPQRSTPCASGVHGANPQHWSRNWQTSPWAMQQFGSVALQPVGHVWSQPFAPQCCGGPPKQRMMPFASALQTSFLPSQQFWEAFTSVLAPQMLPGGLQAPPLLQRLCSHRTSLLLPVFTLQQSFVASQKSPVMRQPPASWQTFTPLPGSTHSREQQVEDPLQGVPP